MVCKSSPRNRGSCSTVVVLGQFPDPPLGGSWRRERGTIKERVTECIKKEKKEKKAVSEMQVSSRKRGLNNMASGKKND